MSYDSTAAPITIGYLMEFTLPPGFPEELFASFTQHTEEILLDSGVDWDKIEQYKQDGPIL